MDQKVYTLNQDSALDETTIKKYTSHIVKFTSASHIDDINMRHLAPFKSEKQSKYNQNDSLSDEYSQILVNQNNIPPSLQPKFNQTLLISNLRHQMVIFMKKNIRKKPIEYFQITLYEICRQINQKLPGIQLKINCIHYLHHILRLKQIQYTFEQEDRISINQNLDEVMAENPYAFQVYQLYTLAIQFISDLAVKYRIINFDNYSYRFTGRTLVANLIDLNQLNEKFFTLECLWFAFMVNELPLSYIVSDLAKQSGKVVLRSVEKIVQIFTEMNTDCPFEEFPTIQYLVVAKKPYLGVELGVDGDYESEVLDYQRLKVSRGIFSWCFYHEDYKKAQQLKAMIQDMEVAYRTFEQELIGCILANIK